MTTHPAPDVATAPDAAPTASRWSYGAVWRDLPRGLGYLLPTFVIAIIVSALLNSLFSTSVGLILIVVGVPLLLLTLLLARVTGTFEVIRLRASGQPPIQEPHWRLDGETTAWRRLLHPVANGHYWLSLLHGAIVAPIIATLSFTVTVVWLSFALAGVAAPIARLAGLAPRSTVLSAETEAAIAVGVFVLGILAILTLPYIVKALVWLHATVARPFLGRFKSEQLEQQVSSLFSSRQSAVAAEGTALRRIERDIHDGPQQRLIRLQMDLSAAERRIAESPEEASSLVADARRQAQDALDELRHLSRGFAPPLLLDRGLFAALESLASRSTIPVSLETELGATANLPDEVARNAYFVASELIANAAKHSQATRIRLAVVAADGALTITVSDDGIGGAVERTGHGLEGLRDRTHGLGGELVIDSPDGGPTVVRATLPLVGVSGASAPDADHTVDREPRA
ncbi:MAG: sensor histidine kinase [Actinobacteria bacterium]|nr:sensor histidine kinase [Actinomycetota bacterium]MBU1610005.1 sensor histidine kinase [Actinomycetota bacterium]MBU2315627.1 sensor histidine kinase [Actinomycetota bacterium]MBU2385481.1 sensor histidine kinase [Actinomycetota bacterium]